MSAALAPLALNDPSALADAGVWRADQVAGRVGAVCASGYAALDAQLPGGGWPVGAMTELLQVQPGLGEWGLLLPALACLSPRVGALASKAFVVLVGAPHQPLAPSLQARGLHAQRLLCVQADTPAERAWASEQALRCADVAAVLAWLPQARADALRRLHLAAHEHGKLLWVLRPAQAQHESSPAPLRLLLEQGGATPLLREWSEVRGHATGSAYVGRVHILKRRGPPLQAPLLLHLQSLALLDLLGAARARAQQRQDELAPAAASARLGGPQLVRAYRQDLQATPVALSA